MSFQNWKAFLQIVLYISYSLNILKSLNSDWNDGQHTLAQPRCMLSLFTEQFQTERVVTIADAFDKLLSHNEIWSDLSVLDKAGL